jgi:hypothetical protein
MYARMLEDKEGHGLYLWYDNALFVLGGPDYVARTFY